jgi:hypothetical protein
MRIVILLLVLVTVVGGCAKVDYLGESFAPTTHVDVYFDEIDVEYEFKIVGRIYASAPSDNYFVSNEKLLQKIKEKAMEHGGDAVIIVGFAHVFTGTSSSSTETTKETEKGTTTTSKTSTTNDEKREIEALVIIYKRESSD